ncbi:MAG: PaaI family thioesterase [Vibrio gallaecicus]
MTKPMMFQDQIPNNHCYGCGAENPDGLQIKSYWTEEDASSCVFMPSSHHSAGPLHFLNGGIISTIIDCHCVCTAIAKGYQLAGRSIGEGETIWFATGKLDVSFLKPVAIDCEVELQATIQETKENKITIDCQLLSKGVVCATANVVAVRVPNEWLGN